MDRLDRQSDLHSTLRQKGILSVVAFLGIMWPTIMIFFYRYQKSKTWNAINFNDCIRFICSFLIRCKFSKSCPITSSHSEGKCTDLPNLVMCMPQQFNLR